MIKITTSINTGTFGSNGDSALNHFHQLAKLFEEIPEQMQDANHRACLTAKQEIEENLIKRGRPGRLFDVNVKKNGPIGLRVSIEQKHVEIQRPFHGQYNSDYAAKIFFNSEMGLVGRKPFVLNQEEISKFYTVSHQSGRFHEGDVIIVSPDDALYIPQIGPFYFSGKSGMNSEPIKKMAFNKIKDQLNLRYKALIRRNNRILSIRGSGDNTF